MEKRGCDKSHATAVVSVALCTHNGAQFVADQVESILKQTYPVAEIVLSDDASEDNTVDVVKQLIAEYGAGSATVPELKVLHNKAPLGVRKNFEQAIKNCTGEYVALCDQDDVWHPNKVELLLESLSDKGTLLVFTDADLIDSNGVELGKTLFGSQLYMGVSVQSEFNTDPEVCAVKRNVVTGATVMFKKELLDLADFFPDYCLHDEWLGLLAVSNGSALLLDDCTIGYRQHDSNQVGAPRKAGFRVFARIARSSRAAEIEGQKQRLLSMVASLEASKVNNQRMLDLARAGIQFHEKRACMPRCRFFRIPVIIQLLLRGDYVRFLSGKSSAVRDLIQAA